MDILWRAGHEVALLEPDRRGVNVNTPGEIERTKSTLAGRDQDNKTSVSDGT